MAYSEVLTNMKWDKSGTGNFIDQRDNRKHRKKLIEKNR